MRIENNPVRQQPSFGVIPGQGLIKLAKKTYRGKKLAQFMDGLERLKPLGDPNTRLDVEDLTLRYGLILKHAAIDVLNNSPIPPAVLSFSIKKAFRAKSILKLINKLADPEAIKKGTSEERICQWQNRFFASARPTYERITDDGLSNFSGFSNSDVKIIEKIIPVVRDGLAPKTRADFNKFYANDALAFVKRNSRMVSP